MLIEDYKEKELFNQSILTGKMFKVKGNYLLTTSDKKEIEVSLNNESKTWLDENYEKAMKVSLLGRFQTYRFEPTIKLHNAELLEDVVDESEFVISGIVFAVYKNCISSYDEEYNYLLVKLKYNYNDKVYLNKVKLYFKELEETQLVNPTKITNFLVKRLQDKLVIDKIISIEDVEINLKAKENKSRKIITVGVI